MAQVTSKNSTAVLVHLLFDFGWQSDKLRCKATSSPYVATSAATVLSAAQQIKARIAKPGRRCTAEYNANAGTNINSVARASAMQVQRHVHLNA